MATLAVVIDGTEHARGGLREELTQLLFDLSPHRNPDVQFDELDRDRASTPETSGRARGFVVVGPDPDEIEVDAFGASTVTRYVHLRVRIGYPEGEGWTGAQVSDRAQIETAIRERSWTSTGVHFCATVGWATESDENGWIWAIATVRALITTDE